MTIRSCHDKMLQLAASVAGVSALAALLARMVWRRLGASPSVAGLSDLTDFVQDEILSEGELTVLLGHFTWQPPGERALIKLSVKPVPLAAGLVPALQTSLSSYSGAEYAYYRGRAALLALVGTAALRPTYSVEVIAPASEKQIARSRPQPGVLISETADLYARAVRPYIEGLDPKSISWIYKCLDLSKEKERVLFNDPSAHDGFLLNVDTKWKSHPDCNVPPEARRAWHGHAAVRDLYCLAICHRTDLRSLRDLRAAHLPLLRRILKVGSETIGEVYGVAPNELRVFVHYQPQFYHFHVHFTRLHNDLGCQVERAHLLQDIIATLEADGEAYAKRTLYYQLKANDKLLAAIKECGAEEKPRRARSPARR